VPEENGLGSARDLGIDGLATGHDRVEGHGEQENPDKG
jgi:hypothetical protein